MFQQHRRGLTLILKDWKGCRASWGAAEGIRKPEPIGSQYGVHQTGESKVPQPTAPESNQTRTSIETQGHTTINRMEEGE